MAAECSASDRCAAGLPGAMPEVVDTCSLASPASVCRTKHLHLRCNVDFTRRALTGTAALTVQSQEDNLRSLVRWDARPVPASPWPPASCLSSRCGLFPGPRPCLLRAPLGAPLQPSPLILHLLLSPHSFLSVLFSSPTRPTAPPPNPTYVCASLLSCPTYT